MRYLALGDSISIDRYTGVDGGGAVGQFARLIGADHVQDLTHDGFTTEAVLESLKEISIPPDIVTLTVGGNDLLQRALWNADRYSLGDPDTAQILERLRLVFLKLYSFHCKVIVNTVYDPTDGDDDPLRRLGLSASFRSAHGEVNNAVRQIGRKYGFLVSDLHALFRGHGSGSADTWITMEIEPNHAGATAIARHWHALFLEPEKGMVLRDIHDGWSFRLGINDYQFQPCVGMSGGDLEWLLVSLRVSSPEASWHWTDPCLKYADAESLTAWLSDVATRRETREEIGFLEPEVMFEFVSRSADTVVLRVCLYHSRTARNGRRWRHEFRQVWQSSTRPLTEPPNPDYMVSVVCREFTVTTQDLVKASESLLENLRQLPTREGLQTDAADGPVSVERQTKENGVSGVQPIPCHRKPR